METSELRVKETKLPEHNAVLTVANHVTDEPAAILYEALKTEGTLHTIFNQGTPPPSLDEFLEWSRQSPNLWMGCLLTDAVTGLTKIVGYGRLNSVQNTGSILKAEISMGFLRKTPMWATEGFCALMFKYAFDDVHLGLMYGFTPESHKAAVRFSQRLVCVSWLHGVRKMDVLYWMQQS